MNEMTVLTLLGWASGAALVLPTVALGYTLYKEAFSSKFLIMDKDGNLLGTISADLVQNDSAELVEMHERIRQSGHDVTIRAAA